MSASMAPEADTLEQRVAAGGREGHGRRRLVQLQGVGKAYPLVNTGRRKLAALWSLLQGRASVSQFVALRDIQLDVWQGQSLGLVGVNGAGKSTLLKLMAGVARPSWGAVKVQGSVGALLELGAGFHPEYSGRQNVHLACALMGMSQLETAEKLDEILAFADIGEHIEQPIKHYSSGMVVRLGFAVATARRPDLLITDEVLAVGDESFQKKCSRWMDQYLSSGGTLILCSHSMYHVQKLCTHAAWIHEGRLKAFGSANDITREYLDWHEQLAENGKVRERAGALVPGDTAIYHIQELWVNGRVDDDVNLDMGDDLTISGVAYSPDGREPVIASSIVKLDGSPVFGTFSDIAHFRARHIAGHRFGFQLHYPKVPLLPGVYKVRGHAMDPEGLRLFDHVERTLRVRGMTRHMGVSVLEHQWSPLPESE